MSHDNSQYIRIDFKTLDLPDFGEFIKTTAFAVYLQLRRYIWRSQSRHPIPIVNQLFASGNLCTGVEHSIIARKLGIKEVSHISRHVKTLLDMKVMKRVTTGRGNVYVLGTWENRSLNPDRKDIYEFYFLDQYFGTDQEPAINPYNPELSITDNPDLSEGDNAGMHLSDKPALPSATRSFNTRNREENTPPRGGGLKPSDKEERYGVFTKAMGSWIDEYRKDKGRSPTPEKRAEYFQKLKNGDKLY